MLSPRIWLEEDVWCFLGLNVAPPHPHWSWFNIKAIKSQLLFSQYIVNELKLSSVLVNLIFFQVIFTVAWLWYWKPIPDFFKYILVISVLIINAVKQKQKIKESHRCFHRDFILSFYLMTPDTFTFFYGSVPNSQTSSWLIKTSAALFFICWWK